MNVWADIYDASGNRLGDGPIKTITNVKVTRKLDGVGSFNVHMTLDARTLALVQNERRIKLWTEDLGGVRLIGEGIIRVIRLSEQTSGMQLSVSGPDILDELKRRTVLLARIYNQQTVSTVVSDLIGLVSPWTADVDASIASDVIDARFDGVTVLAALQEIVKRYGVHLRYSATTSQEIEIGPFGSDNGLRVSRVDMVTPETLANPSLMLVERMENTDNTEELVNRVIALGAGEGVAALTLETSTRGTPTDPYDVQTVAGPDGSDIYYIEDSASVTANGLIEKVIQFKEIAPLSNSETDIRNAANALYDAAVSYLLRHKDEQAVYSLTVRNVKENVVPGDKIDLDYISRVDFDGVATDVLRLRAGYWVLNVAESIGLSGGTLQLNVSNVDRRPGSVVEMVHETIEQVRLRNLKPPISGSTRSYVYDREITNGVNAVVPVEFTDATLEVQRVRVRVKTSPLRATAEAAATHTHQISTAPYAGSLASPTKYVLSFLDINNNSFQFEVWGQQLGFPPTPAASVTLPQLQPVDLVYGIQDDTEHPQTITIWVNGVDRTTLLTGSATLAPSNAAIDVVLDAGELTNLLINAAGGLRQVHDVEIRCSAGQGRAEVTVEIYEVVQAIKLG